MEAYGVENREIIEYQRKISRLEASMQSMDSAYKNHEMSPDRIKKLQILIARQELKIQLVLASKKVEVGDDFLGKFDSSLFHLNEPIYMVGDRYNGMLYERLLSSEKIDAKTLTVIVAGGGDTSNNCFLPFKGQEPIKAVRFLKEITKSYIAIGIGHMNRKYSTVEFPFTAYADIKGDSPMDLGNKFAEWVKAEAQDRIVFERFYPPNSGGLELVR